MTVKTAVIGLGIMGRRMLAQMKAHEGFEPIALWDPNPEACAQAAVLAPKAVVAENASTAMDAADLVYLACPPVPRHALTLEAAAAGKALFIEKPLGVDLAASEAMVEAIKDAGVPAAVNFTQAAGAALTGVAHAAKSGALGDLIGVDIVVTYAAWPRAWQVEADWLRFRAEGGMTREVLSHFLFFSERILGPLTVRFAHPTFPSDPTLCETHLLARLETAEGLPVSILASVGGAQPDRQELTIKGSAASRRITDFYVDAVSNGGPFTEIAERPSDPRATSLRAQLDAMLSCVAGRPHPLATPQEALRVQRLAEAMLGA
jgi:predicted dehydrogenase